MSKSYDGSQEIFFASELDTENFITFSHEQSASKKQVHRLVLPNFTSQDLDFNARKVSQNNSSCYFNFNDDLEIESFACRVAENKDYEA